MNEEYEKRLESEVDQLLKTQPELAAPALLMKRVMAAIEARVSVPWYRRAWQTWPNGLQAASLGVLLTMFGVLCIAGWQLERMHGYDLFFQEIGSVFSGVLGLWNAFLSILGAIALVAGKLGNVLLIAGVVAMALAWAACLGLGTVCVKLAWARR